MTSVFTVGLCVGHISARWNDKFYLAWLAALVFMNFGLYIADRQRDRRLRSVVQQDTALRQWLESFEPCSQCGRPLYGQPAKLPATGAQS